MSKEEIALELTKLLIGKVKVDDKIEKSIPHVIEVYNGFLKELETTRNQES